jgi:hypothetical protein
VKFAFQDTADMLSARIPQVLGYQVVDILLRSLFLLGLFIPTFSIAKLSIKLSIYKSGANREEMDDVSYT